MYTPSHLRRCRCSAPNSIQFSHGLPGLAMGCWSNGLHQEEVSQAKHIQPTHHSNTCRVAFLKKNGVQTGHVTSCSASGCPPNQPTPTQTPQQPTPRPKHPPQTLKPPTPPLKPPHSNHPTQTTPNHPRPTPPTSLAQLQELRHQLGPRHLRAAERGGPAQGRGLQGLRFAEKKTLGRVGRGFWSFGLAFFFLLFLGVVLGLVRRFGRGSLSWVWLGRFGFGLECCCCFCSEFGFGSGLCFGFGFGLVSPLLSQSRLMAHSKNRGHHAVKQNHLHVQHVQFLGSSGKLRLVRTNAQVNAHRCFCCSPLFRLGICIFLPVA